MNGVAAVKIKGSTLYNTVGIPVKVEDKTFRVGLSDKKSVAFRVLLQDTHKTLTDAEAEAAIARLIKVLQEEFDAKLRR